MKILGVSGSLRQGSYNTLLLEKIGRYFPRDIKFKNFVRAKEIPVFDEDLEASGVPEAVALLNKDVAQASLVIFSTPEYNQSLPGSTKKLIDWMSRSPSGNPLQNKYCAVTGATTGKWGTRIAQQQLTGVLASSGAKVLASRLYWADAGTSDPNGQQLEDFAAGCTQACRAANGFELG